MMRKWLEDLAQNETAVKRIEHLLNHTLSDEDGAVFPSITDAAEVFGLMFTAYTAGFDDLGVMTNLAGKGVTDRTIGRVELGRIDIHEERDLFEFTTTNAEPTDMMVQLY